MLLPRRLCMPLLMVCVVGGCGGGGGCERTEDRFAVDYVPRLDNGFKTGGPNNLTYKLGEPKRWELRVSGLTQACLTGLKISVLDGWPPLPAGIQLDPKTGTLSTSGLVKHVEGRCLPSLLPSVNGQCPSGQSLERKLIYAHFTTDHLDQERVSFSFGPEQ